VTECEFATGLRDPWCPGCGHTLVARALQETLARSYKPHDVVLVSDIGCIGMADVLFTCHTVHGLHGRAPALASGIAMTMDGAERKKVVCLMGDGGAAIGLQHVMECARLNVDVTLVVCNNQNYGMTGGQHSAYTETGIKTTTTPAGNPLRPFPLGDMVAPLGVLHGRVLAASSAELREALERCLAHRGFSLLETFNYCPSYSGKLNPESLAPKEMKRFFSEHGVEFGLWDTGAPPAPYRFRAEPRLPQLKEAASPHRHALDHVVDLLIAGSAGEGVQTAAELLAEAAIASGLEVAVRGEYPVTVGKGFSCSFVRLSPEPIGSPITDTYDVGLVTSVDGVRWTGVRGRATKRTIADSSLELPEALAGAERHDLRRFGPKQAAFAGLASLLLEQKWFPAAALRETLAGLRSPKMRDGLTGVLDTLESERA